MRQQREAIAAFRPDAASRAHSMVSAQASYGPCVSHAVFRSYPGRAYHHRQMCKQLFLTYCNVQDLTLHLLPFTRTKVSTYDMRQYVTQDKRKTTAFLKRIRDLCSEWHASAGDSITYSSRTLTLHSPHLRYLDVCVQGHALAAVHYIQIAPLCDISVLYPSSYGASLTNVRNVVLNLEHNARCQAHVLTGLFKSLGPPNRKSQLEVLEIYVSEWQMVPWTTWQIFLAREFPCLKKLVLQCKSVDVSFMDDPFFSELYPLRIHEWTPQFQQLQVSTGIAVNPESMKMLLENGVFITRV